ncbi:RNA polymerase sigma factor FliA [Dyadobacter sp. CECT 9623]|jgi:RNA polymerase sigma factor (sigma-70 family)|uniref:RNA polymerase sigma factor FliA n=1 Tax=Dyadobacter linearis TaxID=2823330 RepID=A0ABM8UM71_9BACT|nr:sigma-70 family RNA polymerase sigma factor [Dyadobacter sp. CECT 9623]CAG5068595.1 RNA polymerase sigma factor FliA [Dyadobacter sp. CECT 9623]
MYFPTAAPVNAITDDAALWLAFRTGDNKALGTLAERYFVTLKRYGLKFMVDETIVDDCIQDLFLELWQNRHKINQTPSVKFYLLKSLRNSIIGHLRYQQRFASEEPLQWDTGMPDHFNAESLLIEQETLDGLITQVNSQMATLPKREREALYLRYFENLSVIEIAEVMGVNRQSVSNFLQKALARIRDRWLVTMVLNLFFF